MTASVMMVTYNRLELTKQTLDNLFKNTKYPINLIIIDNNSTDDTVNYLNDLQSTNSNVNIQLN